MAARIPARLVAALRGSRHTVVLTGSGISAGSGIPTFGDPQSGLWARYRTALGASVGIRVAAAAAGSLPAMIRALDRAG